MCFGCNVPTSLHRYTYLTNLAIFVFTEIILFLPNHADRKVLGRACV